MADARDEITDALRGRVLRGLEAATLRAGDRLPSARDLVAEFRVDHRLILAAYRQLASEGLVEVHERGGIYVALRHGGRGGMPPLPEQWFAELLTQGLAREIPAAELHEWLRRCTETLRLRAVAVTSTGDQAFGLCRELRDDFGLESEELLVDELVEELGRDALPLPLRRADLIITTEAHAERMRAVGRDLRKPVVVVTVRPDIVAGEWALLLRRPVYVVVVSPEFGAMLSRFFETVRGVENLRILVFGRDDVSAIPADAPTYVTQRVRASLQGVRIPGRILPAARTISTESAREIFAFIVRSNIEALSRRTP